MTGAAPSETIVQLSQVLYREAALLDDGCYEAWLELLHDDLVYTAPIREDLAQRAQPGEAAPEALALSFFQDGKGSLTLRVGKLRTGLSQTENPPSRVVRLISNILVSPESAPGEHPVRSAFLVYRQHRQRDVEMLAGHRLDVWRRTDRGWALARREVRFAANVLPVQSLPLFY
jgi:3-phenylpropionate/cinnamic acid dioxygenase small subunit